MSKGTSTHIEIPYLRNALYMTKVNRKKQEINNDRLLMQRTIGCELRNKWKQYSYKLVELWTAPSPAQITSRPMDDNCFNTSVCSNMPKILRISKCFTTSSSCISWLIWRINQCSLNIKYGKNAITDTDLEIDHWGSIFKWTAF